MSFGICRRNTHAKKCGINPIQLQPLCRAFGITLPENMGLLLVKLALPLDMASGHIIFAEQSHFAAH